jgi:MSHA biogenesis protein MshL
MTGHFQRRLAVPLAVSVWAVLASPAYSQAVAPRGDIPVTRLQGAGAGPAPGGVTRQPQPSRQSGLSSLPMTELDDRRTKADLDGPRRIDLSLARPLPLQDMLLLLVNGTPLSIVTDEAVQGTFIGDLKGLSMRQALEAVLFPSGLDYDLQGTLIRVFAHKPSTRFFEVNVVSERRRWERGIGGAAEGTSGTPSVQVVASGESDRFEELGRGVRALLSETGRMHVDRAAGLVQVTDFSERLDQVGIYLEAVQLRATRQVRIDARVFEITLADPAAASIEWKAAGARPGNAGARTTGMSVADPEALLAALGRQGAVRMIAAPQIVAMNNEPAVMRVGTRSVYFERASSGESGRTPREWSPTTVLEGLTLMVTPQVAGDGAVQLSVAPAYAEKTGEAKSARGEVYPLLHISEADTLVRVQDGDTVVISGFLQDRSRTKSGAGIASYFGVESHETVRSELVILLTPVVLGPGGGSASAAR